MLPSRRFSFLRQPFAVIFLLLVALCGAAFTFAYPWLPAASGASAQLERYTPLRDGDASFNLALDAQQMPLRWQSTQTRQLTPARALGGALRDSTLRALARFFGVDADSSGWQDALAEQLAHAQLFQASYGELTRDNEITRFEYISLVTPRGTYLLQYANLTHPVTLTFDPPALTLPAQFKVDDVWRTEGRSGTADYQLERRVTQHGAVQVHGIRFDDCYTIETRLVIASTTRSEDDFCAGEGLVQSRTLDENGATQETIVVMPRDRALPAALSMPPPQHETPAERDAEHPKDWTFTFLTRAGNVAASAENTIAPLYVPTNPPHLLTAAYTGDMFAFDPNDVTQGAAWTFHPEGIVYGPPAFDAASGRLYFGATDKRLYALDARGLFLWSFRAQDNVASRPVIVNDRVVFGSEEGAVYALDAATGKLIWRAQTSGPIVSSPAAFDGTVFIGSDDGMLYALDVNTGAARWTYRADDAIESPVAALNNVVYVTSRDGMVTALDAGNGAMLWQSSADAPLRTAPVIHQARVYVADERGRVNAFDANTGALLWRTAQDVFVGAPFAFDAGLIAAGSDGNVYWLDRDGQILNTWKNERGSSFVLGASAGGGALWFADTDGGVWRLGPPLAAPVVSLAPAWVLSVSEPPFVSWKTTSSPVRYGDRALALDDQTNVYAIEPSSGEAHLLGRIADTKQAPRVDAVAAGDVLFTIVGDTLYASQLPETKQLWQQTGAGFSIRPVQVAGDTIVWTTASGDFDAHQTQANVQAIDRATGARNWARTLETNGFASGAVVRGETVYLNSPASALDLRTGATRWETDVGLISAGEPVLDPAGDTLYLAAMDGQQTFLVALDTRDGMERWRKPVPLQGINALDALVQSGDVIVLSGLDGALVGASALDGTTRWTYEPPAPRLGTIFFRDGRVWFQLQNGRVLALDAGTGELVAQFADMELNLEGVGLAQHPLVMDKHILLPVGAGILGLNAP